MKLEYIKNLSFQEIPQLTQEILTKIEAICGDFETLFDVRLSLEEALINAVKYGNKNDREKKVKVDVIAAAGSITIEVKDEGCGFDFRNLADPTDNENIDKLSGRGVFLIRNIMDKVEFLDNGSRIKMVKKIPGRG
jgi:serine/threonine-protein kinase RsbW